MKIAIDAHSIGSQAGGNETYFRQLIRGLAVTDSNHHFILFRTDSGKIDEIESDRRFTSMRIPKNPLLRLGVSLPYRLKKLRPDVFHCQYVQPPFNRSRTVVTIHDLAHEHYPDFFSPIEALRMKKMVRATAQRADHILTVSQFCADDIERRCRVPRKKITVAYQSPADVFHPRDKQTCQDRLAQKYGIASPFILYVGRMQARKNLPRLVEAYSRLRKQGASEKLVLVGARDWGAERVTEKIREMRLEDSVIFPGYMALHDLPLFYNAAEVFVFPSMFEGFGLPVLEGMASGVPTVTSTGSSLQEVAGDGALLVDPLDVHSLADGIHRVLSDRGLRDQLITRGLRRSADFSLERFAQAHIAIYEKLGS
jgi:glycosyltransferase involved in cell wall biosynthesis